MIRFNLLLIAVFALVTTPVMAAIVEISITGNTSTNVEAAGKKVGWTPDDPSTTDINEGAYVIKLTYSVAPDPVPTKDDITTTPPSGATFRLGQGTDNNSRTYYLIWEKLVSTPPPVTFTLLGYKPVRAEKNSGNNNIDLSGDGVTSGNNKKLVLADRHIPGLGYAIVAANNTAIASTIKPTLPTINAPNAIIKVKWTDTLTDPPPTDDGTPTGTPVSEILANVPMPDLYTFLVGGGSLNLRVNEPGTENRLGSKNDEGEYDDDHNRNNREVIINEVMWAQDQSKIGNPTEIVLEQWIELYNRTTTPIAFSDMKLTALTREGGGFPAPPTETDLLSNVKDYGNTWNLGDHLGKHGSTASPRREFKSMQRVNTLNGWDEVNWSVATATFLQNFRGTPGKSNRGTVVPTARTRPARDNPAKNKIVINEIGNFTDDQSDWIELRNVTSSPQSLNNWALTLTIGDGDETEIVRFPNYSIAAHSVLLLVNSGPRRTPLAMGFNISLSAADQEFGSGPHRYLIVDDNKLNIPNNSEWLLILRSNRPWNVGGTKDSKTDPIRNVYQTGFRLEDAVGPGALHRNFKKLEFNNASPSYEKKADGKPGGDIWDTKVFPLNGNVQADGEFLQDDRLTIANKVWERDSSKQGYLKDAWKKSNFTGIGYDRSVENIDRYYGTPGYINNVAKGKISQLGGGKLIISELMLTTNNRRYPQWIELYNTSATRIIDLAEDSSDPKTGWQLIIENHDSGSWKQFNRNVNITINLKDLFRYILPKQTVLIISSQGRSSTKDYFPDSRVASIYDKKRVEFSMTDRKDMILNAEGGFYVKIVDGDGTLSDEIGNLDGRPPNPREGIGLDDPYSWNWPTELTDEGHRTSLIRIRDAGVQRTGVPDRSIRNNLRGAVMPMGTQGNPAGYAWVHAVDTAFKRVPTKELWYGSSSDIGTPGFVRGTPLPVSLSLFRATLENGESIIRWTTESEIDNAGFNILRTHHKNGTYKKINTELIQGAGTTSERNTYKWVDTTAKPGVVYYYQIEDVSLAGEHNILTATRLKGLISAKNKLTTTWSELKSLR